MNPMLLRELANKETETDGTYVGLKLTSDSKERVREYIAGKAIPNPIDEDDLHITLIYSRKALPKFKARGELDPPIEATPKSFDIFKSQSGKSVLVLKLDSPELTARHKAIRKEHGATHDFPDYIPHVTFSYDVGDDFDLKSVKAENVGKVSFGEEYSEPLQLDWKESKDKKKD